MRTATLYRELPVRKIGVLVAVAFVLSFGYSILVMQQFLAWIAFWASALGVGLALFVVSLLYRLVVAVETIAEDA